MRAGLLQSLQESPPQFGNVSTIPIEIAHGNFESGCHTSGQCRGLGSWPATLLLVPAKEHWLQMDAPAEQQRADPGRPAEFMGAHRERRHAESMEIDDNLADGLGGIGMDCDLRSAECLNRLNGARLMVDELQRREPNIG
jgi:hypothetical protein